MALLKKLSLNILSIVISLIFLFGLFVFYILKAELKPVIQEINLSESIAIPNILSIHNTFHEVESGENMTVIFEKYKVPKNLTYEILNSEFKKSFSDKTGMPSSFAFFNLEPGDFPDTINVAFLLTELDTFPPKLSINSFAVLLFTPFKEPVKIKV